MTTSMVKRSKAALGGGLLGLAFLAFAGGPVAAQEPSEAGAGTPAAGGMGMMGEAAPASGDAKSPEDMEQMMERCMEMMDMMMGMMGGEMSGMAEGDGMEDGAGTPEAAS